MNVKSKISTLVAASALVLVILAGCSTKNAGESSSESKVSEGSYPVTVKNYSLPDNGSAWKEKDQTFDAAPKRVVANTQGIAEMMIHLGLADKIVGVAALANAPEPGIAEEFNKIPVLAKGYVGKEITVGANPDLIIGRGGLFANADWGVGTVDDLNNLGIKTFVQKTSTDKAKFDDLYEDIDQIGQIFNVPDNAKKFSDEIKAREQKIEDNLKPVKSNLTYAYVSEVDGNSVTGYSGNTDTYLNDALTRLKLTNTFEKETGEITAETLVKNDPDIFLVTYYDGGRDPEKIKEDLYNNPALSTVKAIKNKQLYTIDFNQFWGYGYQIVDGMEKLGSEVYPEQFKK